MIKQGRQLPNLDPTQAAVAGGADRAQVPVEQRPAIAALIAG